MQCIEIPLSGCYEITPSLYKDARGYFFEAFNKKAFKATTGLDFEVFKKTNLSL
jgi:dTDP-4-dehydrorhamnose 3,5-epimerase